MTTTLSDRTPAADLDRLVADLVPPPRFAHAGLDNYIPDPEHPSQARAVETVGSFAGDVGRPRRQGLFRRRKPRAQHGLYLDGGFGVGKTHLLTALFHQCDGHRVYGTFVEFTNIAGALGFQKTVDLLAGATLVCIDEFELDDPGDTLLMTRMIRELSDRGVALATTSNTLPDALGEGRFAAQDFLREIKSMADRFTVVPVDGEDYRHRDALADYRLPTADEVRSHAADGPASCTLDGLDDLLDHLATVHPSRYRMMLDGVEQVHITGLRQLDDHRKALLLVVLIDRLYELEIPVLAAGIDPKDLFSEPLLASGYRKKYRRALSRLTALGRDGVALLERAEAEGIA